MNCKKGDLAIIVGGAGENIGKIVECIQFKGQGPIKHDGRVWHNERSGGHNYWLAEAKGSPLLLTSLVSVSEACIEDSWLRPIRGEEDKSAAPAKEKELQS